MRIHPFTCFEGHSNSDQQLPDLKIYGYQSMIALKSTWMMLESLSGVMVAADAMWFYWPTKSRIKWPWSEYLRDKQEASVNKLESTTWKHVDNSNWLFLRNHVIAANQVAYTCTDNRFLQFYLDPFYWRHQNTGFPSVHVAWQNCVNGTGICCITLYLGVV